jgi:poly-beta-1,6-N-acetyl-D-glucosamine synthase
MLNLFLIFVVVLLFFSIIGFLLQVFKKLKKVSDESHYLKEISVVIPFRNESENLEKLLTCIENSFEYPKEFIFVNDHSEDDFKKYFSNKKYTFSYTLIDLKENEIGKKRALEVGINEAEGKYILTLDADIEFSSSFFSALSTLEISSMTILPVVMRSLKCMDLFFELDFYYVNSINNSFSSFFNPILASGANLLFNKKDYLTYSSLNNHISIPSGDDVFLLNDFKKANLKIQVCTNADLCVETNVPNSLLEKLNQRVRWISKTSKVNDKFAFFLGFLGMLYQLGFFIFGLMFIIDANYMYFTYLILGKISCDFLTIFPYLTMIRRKTVGVFIPVFSIVYPVYFLSMMLLSKFTKPTWKGRK